MSDPDQRALRRPHQLFVPRFANQPGGTGIGLALCRRIAEAHGGWVPRANREETYDCVATVCRPLRGPRA